MTTTTLEMPADFESIRAIGAWLRTTMDQLEIDSTDNDLVGPIELAVHELATNCIDHAEAQKISIGAAVNGHLLTVTVSDDGAHQFEPTAGVVEPAEPQVRGYGLMIVEQVATSVDYQRLGNLNEWQLQFSVLQEDTPR